MAATAPAPTVVTVEHESRERATSCAGCNRRDGQWNYHLHCDRCIDAGYLTTDCPCAEGARSAAARRAA